MADILVGIVSAPQLPAKLVYKLVDQLENDLQSELSGRMDWKVEVEIDRLTGAAETIEEIMNETQRIKKVNNWDYAISFTDLPIFYGKYVVLADADVGEKLAQLSLPALGMRPTAKRIKLIMLHMVKELYYRNSQTTEDIQLVEDGIGVKQTLNHHQTLFGKFMKTLRFSKVRRVELSEKKEGISVRFLIKPLFGRLLLVLSGMTIANQPWTIMPSFKKVVGLAFATGSYMLVFTTLWQLSYLYDVVRFILLMIFAIGGMTVWTIFVHNLWERKDTHKYKSSRLRHIYNASTVLTLLSSIIIFYISLFILFLFAVIIFVPPDMFKKAIDEDVGIINYLSLVWLVTSAATVAGAIGAGLENEEVVRTSTYGYRQYIRSKEVEREEEKKEREETGG